MNKEEGIQRYNLNRNIVDNAINLIHQMRQTKKRIKESSTMMNDCAFVSNYERWSKAGTSLNIALEKLEKLENRFMKIPIAERAFVSNTLMKEGN